MIKLGDKVRDRISGYEGIATGKFEYINGCVRWGVQAKVDKEGKMPDTMVIDEGQLEVVKKAAVKLDAPAATTGGPRDNRAPPR